MSRATVGRAYAPARGRRLCFAAQRRRRHCRGHACRRTGAGAARADGRGGRDRDAEGAWAHRPQVPDLLRPRDGTRRWPADLPGRVGDSPLIASPVDAGVRRSAACVGQCSTAQARWRSSLSTTALRSLSSPRSPSSFVSGRAPGSGTSSPRGRSPATVGGTTRLLLSTTRRDAFSPSPTPLDRATTPRHVRRLSRSIRYRLCSRGV